MSKVNLKIWAPTEDLAWEIKRYLERDTYIFENTKIIFWNQRDVFSDILDDGSKAIIVTWDMPVDKEIIDSDCYCWENKYFNELAGYNDKTEKASKEILLSTYINTVRVPDMGLRDNEILKCENNYAREPDETFIFLPYFKEFAARDDFDLEEYLCFCSLKNKVARLIIDRKTMRKGLGIKAKTDSCSYTVL